MKKLSEMKKESKGVITSVNGDPRFISRITSIGLTPGCGTGSKTCAGCMPEGGFQNMGVMWEVVK